MIYEVSLYKIEPFCANLIAHDFYISNKKLSTKTKIKYVKEGKKILYRLEKQVEEISKEEFFKNI